MTTDFRQAPTTGYLDAHLGSSAAQHRLQHLYDDAATRRLIRERRRHGPVGGPRRRLADTLRRLADRLAPIPRPGATHVVGSH